MLSFILGAVTAIFQKVLDLLGEMFRRRGQESERVRLKLQRTIGMGFPVPALDLEVCNVGQCLIYLKRIQLSSGMSPESSVPLSAAWSSSRILTLAGRWR